MIARFGILAKCLTLLALSFCVSACGGGKADDSALQASAVSAIARGSGAFNGSWNVSLKAKKDTCQLGLTKPVATKIVIQQTGSKIKLTIPGLPKYAGTVSGNRLSGGGVYNITSSGKKTRLTGTVKATLASKKKITINSARVNVSQPGLSCYLILAGSGTKA